jgi:transposase
MRQIIEVLRLKHQHQLSIRDIASSCGLSPSTVGDCLSRAQGLQLGWPLPEGLSESDLHARLYEKPSLPSSEQGVNNLPDWSHIQSELRRPNVTVRLLWQEYRRSTPNSLGYSRFCQCFNTWRKALDPTLRQVHVPGEKLFVDWAGQTVPIQGSDGTLTRASLFVAVMGASNKIFAEAFADQKLHSWILAHVHAYAFYSGVPQLTVPDNAKTAVNSACRYEPILHRTYQEMAEHYGTTILPTRIKRPRDKAKVETAVQIAQRQILAALRDVTFFSVDELNQAITTRLAQINAEAFQKLEGTRDNWFETLDRPKLKPLPMVPFSVAVWSEAKVNIDYHIVFDRHYYSVPYAFIHQTLDVRATETTVELFHEGKRVAAHARSHQPGKFTTLDEHRPKSHQRFLEWTPSRMIGWSQNVGPLCASVVEQILASRPHPEQGFRSCLGIIRLAKAYTSVRVEAACKRALHYGTLSYRSIESILKNRLDEQPLEESLPQITPLHDNVRGGTYYR